MFINTGNEEFAIERKGEYVDKSMLISFVNSRIGMRDKFLCVTRARRFGKSIAAKMLNAYYDESADSRSLFADLKIAKEPTFEEHLNKYPVIYLDVSGFTADIDMDPKRVVNTINDALSADLIETYPEASIDPAAPLSIQLVRAVDYTHKPFIMIIDEWDAVLREIKSDAVKKKYVGWLRTLFKNAHTNKIFAGVYMTGILPIKQYNTESTLNNFEEFTMTNPGDLAGCFGFTSAEVGVLCKKYKMDQELIKQWYDGYRLGDMDEIYNPYAVMSAIKRNSIESYWTATAAYEGLRQYISMNYEGLKDAVVELLAGQEVRVDIDDFANDIHEATNRNGVLTLLVHLGYLSYNGNSQTVKVPNYEVRREFVRTIQDGNWKHLAKIINGSEQLIADTLAGDAKSVERAIDYAHQDSASMLKYNDENSLACALSIAYIAGWKDYIIRRELPEGRGFADIVLIPRRNVDKPAVVIELKWNHSAESGLEQIKEKRYAESLSEYVGEVVLVGVNYDKDTKEHSCVIERMVDGKIVESGERRAESGNVPSSEEVMKIVNERGVQLSKNQSYVLMAIVLNPSITHEEISAHCEIPLASVNSSIEALKKKGVLKGKTNRRKGVWELLIDVVNKMVK